MTTATGKKTITNTAAAVFAGSSVLANRVFVYVKNLDDCVAICYSSLTHSEMLYYATAASVLRIVIVP